MVIPDDLPRSPTGRVPQWVIDEASGRTPDTAPWRTSEPTGAPARQRRLWPLAAVVVLMGVVAFALSWSSSPWATAHPPADVAALADEATMTDAGRDLFYHNDPQLLDAADFPGRCPAHASGCYNRALSSIVVYEPADDRLHGWVVTTAAHEMLHAAYDSLSPSDRRDVDQLLASAVATLSPDNPVLAQIDASVGDHEQSRSTEQFAYLGTEAPTLDPRLEEVYARFLADRQTVVSAYLYTATTLATMATELQYRQQSLTQLETEGRTAEAAEQRSAVSYLSDDLAMLQNQLTVAD